MQRLLRFLFAIALVFGLASTIVASAHSIRHADVLHAGHSGRASPVDQSHWLI
ncbi:MAG: hypothetical protein NVSMB26_22630 [Beijerinckiaceae bacterium]